MPFGYHLIAIKCPLITADDEALCVAHTFQYGDSARFAYGKRTRLMQAGLWHMSPYWLQPPPPRLRQQTASFEPHEHSQRHQQDPGDQAGQEEQRFVIMDEEAAERALASDYEAFLARDASLAVGMRRNDSRALIRLHKLMDAR